MTPPDLVRLNTIPVYDDRPGTLSSHIARLKRAWREQQLERDRRIQREVRAVFQEARRRQ